MRDALAVPPNAQKAGHLDPRTTHRVLGIAGHLPRPCSFSIRTLQALPRHELGPTDILCFTGRPVAQVQSYAGARLTDLLDAGGFSEQPRSELKRCIVVAHGEDGYQAIFSWSELYNSAIGEKVLVLYERNGEPLDAHLGAICLISARDSRLGPRHLRGLFEVAVRKL